MAKKTIKVKVLRFDPTLDKEPYYKTYEVPSEWGMSAMDVLDYIYENLDSSLAYFSHAACRRGVCGRCTLRIDGKPKLACQTTIKQYATIEPLQKTGIIRDLINAS